MMHMHTIRPPRSLLHTEKPRKNNDNYGCRIIVDKALNYLQYIYIIQQKKR